jgi:hypothetical protein
LASHPLPQAEGQPLLCCLRLLILYFRSYPQYLKAVSSISNLRTRHAVLERDPLNMESVHGNKTSNFQNDTIRRTTHKSNSPSAVTFPPYHKHHIFEGYSMPPCSTCYFSRKTLLYCETYTCCGKSICSRSVWSYVRRNVTLLIATIEIAV